MLKNGKFCPSPVTTTVPLIFPQPPAANNPPFRYNKLQTPHRQNKLGQYSRTKTIKTKPSTLQNDQENPSFLPLSRTKRSGPIPPPGKKRPGPPPCPPDNTLRTTPPDNSPHGQAPLHPPQNSLGQNTHGKNLPDKTTLENEDLS